LHTNTCNVADVEVIVSPDLSSKHEEAEICTYLYICTSNIHCQVKATNI